MHWIAPAEKDTDNAALEKRLRDAAGQAVPAPTSGLQSQECSAPVFGLIFLRFAEIRFAASAAPSFRLIQKLYLRIQNLRRTRDLLLPRLLSRQVDLGEN